MKHGLNQHAVDVGGDFIEQTEAAVGDDLRVWIARSQFLDQLHESLVMSAGFVRRLFAQPLGAVERVEEEPIKPLGAGSPRDAVDDHGQPL